jgi:ABC-type antimicrobial peptide transport system permease subunit
VGDYFYGLGVLTVKTAGDPRTAAPIVHGLLRELDPELAVPPPRTMSEIVEASVAERRFQMHLMLLLGAAAVFLSALGIYAVVAQAVVQRTPELGVRMALGAGSRQILGLVLRRALVPVGLGLAAGIALALGTGRVLQALLFGVSATDVMPVAAASLFLVAIALLASVIPARRATRIDPIETLRAG